MQETNNKQNGGITPEENQQAESEALTAAKDKKYSDTMKQWYEEYGYEIDYEGLDIPIPETAEAAE